MSQQIAAPRPARFSIGRVLRDSFGIMGRNLIPFAFVSLALHAVLVVLPRSNPATVFSATGDMTWSSYLVEPFLRPLVADLVQLALMFAVLNNLRGQKTSLADFTHGVRFVPQVAAASVIGSLPSLGGPLVGRVMSGAPALVLGVGMLSVAILSLLVMIIWWVAAQSIAIERKGVIDGLRRSAQLTEGRRWQIFGLTLVLSLIVLPVMFAVSVFGKTSLSELAFAQPTTPVGAIWFAAAALLSAFNAVAATVGFSQLRAEKDGLEGEEVWRVFE